MDALVFYSSFTHVSRYLVFAWPRRSSCENSVYSHDSRNFKLYVVSYFLSHLGGDNFPKSLYAPEWIAPRRSSGGSLGYGLPLQVIRWTPIIVAVELKIDVLFTRWRGFDSSHFRRQHRRDRGNAKIHDTGGLT